MYNKIATVRNLTTNGGSPAPNQFEIRQGELLIFQSYNSTICIIDYRTDTITFGRDWDYSRTTYMYLYKFLNDNGVNLHGMKEIVEAIEKGTYENVGVYVNTIYNIEYEGRLS